MFLILMQAVINGKHIEGSPIANEVGPANTHMNTKVKIQVNEANENELYNFHIVAPHTVEINDFEVETLLKYSENGEVKSMVIPNQLSVSEVQQIDVCFSLFSNLFLVIFLMLQDFLVHSFDSALGEVNVLGRKKSQAVDPVPRSKSGVVLKKRLSKKFDPSEIQTDEPKSPRGGRISPRGEKPAMEPQTAPVGIAIPSLNLESNFLIPRLALLFLFR